MALFRRQSQFNNQELLVLDLLRVGTRGWADEISSGVQISFTEFLEIKEVGDREKGDKLKFSGLLSFHRGPTVRFGGFVRIRDLEMATTLLSLHFFRPGERSGRVDFPNMYFKRDLDLGTWSVGIVPPPIPMREAYQELQDWVRRSLAAGYAV